MLCNDAELLPPSEWGGSWEVAGDPTEGALLALAAKLGLERPALDGSGLGSSEIPFDSDRKRMTTVHRSDPRDGGRVASKGAVEAILEVSTGIADTEGDRPISDADRDLLLAEAAAFADEGYRVLAIASGERPTDEPGMPATIEANLTVLGLVAMADPPDPNPPQRWRPASAPGSPR